MSSPEFWGLESFEGIPPKLKKRMRGWKPHRPHANKRRKEIQHALRMFSLWRAAEGRCYLCGDPLEFEKGVNNCDHVFPRSDGYTASNNMMPVHVQCNSAKQDAWPDLNQLAIVQDAYTKAGLTFNPTTYGGPHLGEVYRLFNSIGCKEFGF